MVLVSENVEFRRCEERESKKNDGSKNYYYTFEDENGSFVLFSRVKFNFEKGDIVNLQFQTRVWSGNIQFNLTGAKLADE